MTRDEITAAAIEAGLMRHPQGGDIWTAPVPGPDYPQRLSAFAAAVERAAYQRGLEDAAQVCEAIASKYRAQHHPQAENIADECGDAIRALGGAA